MQIGRNIGEIVRYKQWRWSVPVISIGRRFALGVNSALFFVIVVRLLIVVIIIIVTFVVEIRINRPKEHFPNISVRRLCVNDISIRAITSAT